MKVKRSISMALAMIFVIVLAGCAAVPDEVNKDIGNRETGKIGTENADPKKMELRPVSEVTAETPDNWTKESGKVKFDGIVKVPEVSELYKWKVEISTEAYENPEKAREVFLKYFDNLAIEERGEPRDDLGGMLRTIDYYDDDEEFPGDDGQPDGITMYETGKFAMGMLTKFWSNVEEGEKWGYGLISEIEKTYYFRKDGTCIEGGEDTWSIYGGESVSVQEMMDCMEEFAEQYKKVEPSAEFVPDRVDVWKLSDRDFYQIRVYETLMYDGVAVDDSWCSEQNIKEYGNLCRLRSQMEQWVLYTDGYPYMTGVDEPYRRREKLETYEKILGLEDAWPLLTGKIADQKNVDFDRADLLYSIWYEPEGDSNELWWFSLSEPPQMFATPVWRFSGWVDKGEKNAEQCTVYVDALTGQVTAYQ